MRKAVLARDEFRCQRCGRSITSDYSLQHRRPRQMGGDRNANQMCNLVTLCGSGTTGCHGWVESHREVAYEQGWLVHRWQEPACTPILRFGRQSALLGDAWTPLREEAST